MLIPAGYRMLLEMEEVEEKTEGGIYLPQQVQDRDQNAKEWGRVVAQGYRCYYDQPRPWCGVGDMVCIVRYNGNEVVDEETGKKYKIINDKDVLCIRHEGKPA